jgi:predicted nucleic acid-binding Zn ribbon protein
MSRRPPDKPKRISEAISQFLTDAGIAERVEQARVVPEWAELVGADIARVTEPQAVTADGRLFVAVRSHGWMSELSLMEPQIVAALNRTPGRAPIRKIHWRLNRD